MGLEALSRPIECSPRKWRVAGGVIVYVAFGLIIDADLWRSGPALLPEETQAVAEAEAWLQGRLHLDPPDDPEYERPWDTALFDGHVYNVFPPLLTLLSAATMAGGTGGLPHYTLLLLLAAPLPGLAYALFLRRTGHVPIAVLFSIGYLAGTSLLPLLNQGIRNGSIWHLNHLASQVGLLIFLIDYFGRRRIWTGAAGLLIAAWSRQMTLLYALPLAWAAWRGRIASTRSSRMVSLVIGLSVTLAIPAALNWAKFGRPWDSGYRYLYAGRDDAVARDAAAGLFGLRFLPRNLYYMNVGLPGPNERHGWWRPKPNVYGTGIWWTTPLLLMLPLAGRRLWDRQPERWLLVSAGLIFGTLMLYHTTGYAQRGFNRFSMDFMLVLLALVAPACTRGWRRRAACAFVVWSVVYFRWWLPQT